jgi:DNA modification methylase
MILNNNPKIEIFNDDCLNILKNLNDKSINLICTDPPYGVRKQEEWDDKEHFLKTIDIWLNECLRVSKTVVWFCAGKMLPYILKNREDVFHRLLVWEKPSGSQFAGAMHSNIWYSIEPILIFGEIPKTDKTKKYGFANFSYRTIPHKEFEHPTTKPLQLMYDLVYFYSNKGDLICDPFMGTGTTGDACKKLNRNFIGIELDEKHFNTAKIRINNSSSETFNTLF